jgi:hypothetical protein
MMMTMIPTMTLISEVDTTAADTAVTTSANSLFLLLLQNANIWIFLIGVLPFGWATIEFWRRIVVGEPFGTGTDSVLFSVIGKDDAPQESRGRRILGQGALITAYLLFVVAFGTMGMVLYSVWSSAPPPTEFVSTTTTAATTMTTTTSIPW